jgi:hypothetical protein
MINNIVDKVQTYAAKAKELEAALNAFDDLKKTFKGRADDYGAFELHILHEAHDLLSAKKINKEQFATIMDRAISVQ